MRQTQARRFRFTTLAQCQPVAVLPFVKVRFYRLVREHLPHFLRRPAAELVITGPPSDKCTIHNQSVHSSFPASCIVPVACAVHKPFVSLRPVCEAHKQIMSLLLQLLYAPRQQERQRHSVITSNQPRKFDYFFCHRVGGKVQNAAATIGPSPPNSPPSKCRLPTICTFDGTRFE